MNHERMGYTATEVNLKNLQNDFLMKEKAIANELDSFKKKRSELKDLTEAISRDALQLMSKRSKLKELKVNKHVLM